MIIIGIGGRAKSGKTTIAKHLVNHHGFHRLSFAENLKQGLIRMFDLPYVAFEDEEMKEASSWMGWSPRALAQYIGTDVCRSAFGENIWVDLMDRKLQHYDDSSRIVIDDVRFENEAKWVRKTGELWVVTRGHGQGAIRNHVSEAGFKTNVLQDSPVWNNGWSMASLEEEVEMWVETALINQTPRVLQPGDVDFGEPYATVSDLIARARKETDIC